jgi:tRNA pseudouridine55 synthase
MDGVLLIDKPSGPTSHDVVVRLRRTTGERGIGHTGTLDPLATGLMALVLGRATRLAPFLSSGDKTYDASIRLGVETDTDDSLGQVVGTASLSLPDDAAVMAALHEFRGAFEQTPPSHSAKKVDGEKAYDLARRDRPVALKPVPVTVRALELLGREGDRLAIRVSATAGFYVRALARDLGRRLGCGAHLDGLRRTRSGWFDLARALPLGEAERMGPDLAGFVIAPAEALPGLPSVEVNEAGLKRVSHGNDLAPEHLSPGWISAPSLFTAAGAPPPAAVRASRDALWACRTEDGAVHPAADAPARRVRVLASDGRLLAIAEPRRGALHPVLVLG